jgi:hypothetical protein
MAALLARRHALLNTEHKIHAMALRVMAGIIEQGGPNFRFYKMLFHELHKAYHALKEVGEELLDEEEK